ncbi:MAG: hypothetical protein WCL06_16210 [Bacteroidota bacterium]
MASYLFGENRLVHPLFVRINSGRNYLLLAEGITKDSLTGIWTAHLLQEFKNHPFLRKCLSEGIRITLSGNDTVYVRHRRCPFFCRIRVTLGKEKLKGRYFSKNKITY